MFIGYIRKFATSFSKRNKAKPSDFEFLAENQDSKRNANQLKKT